MNNINFRPLVKTDLPMLHRWLETPHVKEYWDSDIQWTESLIQQKFGTEREGINFPDHPMPITNPWALFDITCFRFSRCMDRSQQNYCSTRFLYRRTRLFR